MQSRSPQFVLSFAAMPLAGMILCASFAAPPAKKTRNASPAAPKAAVSAPDPAIFKRDILPLLDKYCEPCHNGGDGSAGISVAGERDATSVLAHRDLWEKIASNIESKHMPPEGLPQPSDAERKRLVAYVQSVHSQAVCDVKDPGRVTARRLNKAEYENTIRDLLGVTIAGLTDDFPSDDVGYGFDNIGDVLTLSPLHMEKYLAAAGKISRTVIHAPEDRAARAKERGPRVVPGDQLDVTLGGEARDGYYHLGTDGSSAGIQYEFPAPGLYRVKVVAWEEHAGPGVAKMGFLMGNQTVHTVDVSATQSKPGTYETTVEVRRAGVRKIAVSFLNNYNKSARDTPDPKLQGDRNLSIGSLEIYPLGATAQAPTEDALSEAQKRLIHIAPAAGTEAAKNLATKKNLSAFLYRAYRRPATAAELDRLVKLAARVRGQGSSFERGMQIAVQAALVSSSFLFRIEQDPDPNNPKAQRPLTDYELATRLSYFLWSSMPDDRLLALAAAKKLQNPLTLQAEAKRMLRDPRASQSLGENFGAQWLHLRSISQVTPDRKQFPQFTEEVRSAMRTETMMYFQGVVGNDRSVLDFLDSDYTYLNEPLAKLYGVSGVTGPQFRRVALSGDQRGGVMTQASVLTVTSNPTRTSPVKRGRWVMENLLGSTIPMPPPGVAELPDDRRKTALQGTLRQRMVQHRADPACASCHSRMDPIGFGLENYDAIGMWRKLDDGNPIDASGALPGGKAFSGPSELKSALKGKSPQFTRNLSERLMTYALGRGIESSDRCNLDEIAANVAKRNYRFSALVSEIVTSEPFRYRRGDEPVAKVVANAKVQEKIHE